MSSPCILHMPWSFEKMSYLWDRNTPGAWCRCHITFGGHTGEEGCISIQYSQVKGDRLWAGGTLEGNIRAKQTPHFNRAPSQGLQQCLKAKCAVGAWGIQLYLYCLARIKQEVVKMQCNSLPLFKHLNPLFTYVNLYKITVQLLSNSLQVTCT